MATSSSSSSSQNSDPIPTLLHLNVGGTYFLTHKSTLCADPNSMFSAMFSGRHPIAKDEQGRYFIDRDPEHFRELLNYMRTGAIPRSGPSEILLREAKFFQVKLLALNSLGLTNNDSDNYLDLQYGSNSEGNHGCSLRSIYCSDTNFSNEVKGLKIRGITSEYERDTIDPADMRKYIEKAGYKVEYRFSMGGVSRIIFMKPTKNLVHIEDNDFLELFYKIPMYVGRGDFVLRIISCTDKDFLREVRGLYENNQPSSGEYGMNQEFLIDPIKIRIYIETKGWKIEYCGGDLIHTNLTFIRPVTK